MGKNFSFCLSIRSMYYWFFILVWVVTVSSLDVELGLCHPLENCVGAQFSVLDTRLELAILMKAWIILLAPREKRGPRPTESNLEKLSHKHDLVFPTILRGASGFMPQLGHWCYIVWCGALPQNFESPWGMIGCSCLITGGLLLDYWQIYFLNIVNGM